MKRIVWHMELLINDADYQNMIDSGNSLTDVIDDIKREFSKDPRLALDNVTIDVKDDPNAATII